MWGAGILRRTVVGGGRVSRSRQWTRPLCSSETVYAEQLQLKEIKSPDFYETHAKDRNYFYHVDLQGQLFLEDTVPKNIATSLKSPKFLSFFFGHLRPNPTASDAFAPFHDYPFISPCGPEMNYIKAADTPVVFTELKHDASSDAWHLITNGSAAIPFQPTHLAISTTTGRLYHWVQHKRMTCFALIKSHVAVELSQSIDFRDDGPHLLRWHDGGVYPVATDTTRSPPSLSQ
ncbi:Aste57867_22204 [Aphanomyces stellatus]|uniref:Aste57867_22204 protein n=1 Tax=Aphanomyces stellatus TaxID=120398 RepID=A0A485LKW1_9STRA|nr:hypothetical protein As57867_022135 [Aphanomyces stellatus]VFT98871.1 Aste57867_22204 [Aphanomyces stellatus]